MSKFIFVRLEKLFPLTLPLHNYVIFYTKLLLLFYIDSTHEFLNVKEFYMTEINKIPSILPKILIVFIIIIAIFFFYQTRNTEKSIDVLYGNVDYREIELAFLDSGRVNEIYVEEGDIVTQNQVLAKLETNRLEDSIEVARARVDATKAQLEKLENGTRPEEIKQAIASVDAAKAQAIFAKSQFNRAEELYKKNALSKLDYEEALQQKNVANAKLELEEKNLELAQIGPRIEDIAQAKALLNESEALLSSLYTQLDDANLKSPINSVVNRRLLEVGDIATPQKAVFSLAILSPKWVRAYISEPQLALFKTGMKASIYSDSFANLPIEATLGFISSVAEFTPKAVETAELRTALVYEVRFYTEDKENLLRLGMPVTIQPLYEFE